MQNFEQTTLRQPGVPYQLVCNVLRLIKPLRCQLCMCVLRILGFIRKPIFVFSAIHSKRAEGLALQYFFIIAVLLPTAQFPTFTEQETSFDFVHS